MRQLEGLLSTAWQVFFFLYSLAASTFLKAVVFSPQELKKKKDQHVDPGHF